MTRERRAGQRPDDERAQPGPALDQILVLELAVRLQHGVGVDRDGLRDLAHGRQLVAGLEQPHPERLTDLFDELEVRGNVGTSSEPELDHAGIPSSIVL